MAKIPIRDLVSVITDPGWHDGRGYLKDIWPRSQPEAYAGVVLLGPEHVSLDADVAHGTSVVASVRRWDKGDQADFHSDGDENADGLDYVIVIDEVYPARLKPSKQGLRQAVIVNGAGQIVKECYHSIAKWADA